MGVVVGGERVVRKDETGEVLYALVAGNAKVHVEQGGLSSTVTMLAGSEQLARCLAGR
jgi:hypothetical protein